MLQDFEVSHARLSADDISLIDKADYFHLTAALGTGQWINLPHLLYVFTPLGGRNLLRPVL